MLVGRIQQQQHTGISAYSYYMESVSMVGTRVSWSREYMIARCITLLFMK